MGLIDMFSDVGQPEHDEQTKHGQSQGGARPAAPTPWDSSEYSMLFFKVLPCQKKYNHDWTCCPGAHPGERARRRCLLVYRYGAKVCPDMQTRGVCPRGESCYMTHGMFEYYMHPLKYKTKMCKSGPTCRRHYCFFSHSPEELRESSSIPDDWHLQIMPDGSVSSSSTAAILSCLPVEARGAAQAAIVQLPQIIQMFESGADRMVQPQHMVPIPGAGQLAQGAAAWGSASMASSSSHFDSGSSLLMQADAAAPYGSPSILGPQHTLNALQQQEMLQQQFGAACGLQHSSPGIPLIAQQQPAGAVHSGQQGMVPAQQQQQPLAGVAPAGAGGVPAGGPAYAQAGGWQPASGGWVPSGAPSQLPYGAVSNSAAMAASPPILGVQGTLLMPAQGGMYMQPGGQVAGGGFQQQQQYVQPIPSGVGLMTQQPSNVKPPGPQLPAHHPASAPLSNTMLLQHLQQLQPQSQAQPQLQQQQPQMLPGAMGPAGGIACTPQQPLSGPTSEQLVQQLQALGLGAAASQQLRVPAASMASQVAAEPLPISKVAALHKGGTWANG